MHCDQCGRGNRSGSKFCRHCGLTLSGDSTNVKKTKVTWKSPTVLILIGLILAGGLFYGGSKAYAYLQVESKISTAKKLQAAGDYKGSIDTLNGWEDKTFTNSQKTRIDGIKTDDQKFVTFKASFDDAVAVENATSTAKTSLSVSLESALKNLQSIDSSYPDFKNVQNEVTKVQNALVAALQNEADTSKKDAADSAALAEKSRQAAVSAQAAKTRAETNASQAQSAADSATANAAAQAAAARGIQVMQSFRNELTTAYNQYINQGNSAYTSGIRYSNAGNSSMALTMMLSAQNVYIAANDSISDLDTRYTNLPASYYDALNNMRLAIKDILAAMNLLVKSEGTTLDYSTLINAYKNESFSYAAMVKSFLDANLR